MAINREFLKKKVKNVTTGKDCGALQRFPQIQVKKLVESELLYISIRKLRDILVTRAKYLDFLEKHGNSEVRVPVQLMNDIFEITTAPDIPR